MSLKGGMTITLKQYFRVVSSYVIRKVYVTSTIRKHQFRDGFIKTMQKNNDEEIKAKARA